MLEPRITLDEWIALNDEIASLARAGLPLERNLAAVGGDLPGRLGALTRAVGERMERGEGLAEALDAEGAGLPGAYRAAVAAGLRTGRLPVALEGLAAFARAHAEMRRAVGLAMTYPLIVLAVAYGLFVALVVEVVPRFLSASSTFRVPARAPLAALARLGETAAIWGPVVPSLLVLGGAFWARSGRAGGLRAGFWRRVPWLGGMLEDSRASSFADLLALLVEHRVPLPEGVELASEASGDPAMAGEGRALAGALRRGDPLADRLRAPGPFPPMLRWLMITGERQGNMASALRHAADSYRRKALARAEFLRVALPVLLLLAVGGTATLAYGLALFLPLTTLLNDLVGDFGP